MSLIILVRYQLLAYCCLVISNFVMAAEAMETSESKDSSLFEQNSNVSIDNLIPSSQATIPNPATNALPCTQENRDDNCAVDGNMQFHPRLEPPPTLPQKLNVNVLDFQEYKESQKISFLAGGDAQGEVELININPKVNMWYILKIVWAHKKLEEKFHLENIYPKRQRLLLREGYHTGIIIKDESGQYPCNLWSQDGAEIKLAQFRKKPFSELCDNKIYLRNKIEGYRTTKEWVVEFLRDNIWGGETITDIVKNTIYKDRYLVDSKIKNDKHTSNIRKHYQVTPPLAKLRSEAVNSLIEVGELGIDFIGREAGEVIVGDWYQSRKQPGAFVSIIKPDVISDNILHSYDGYVKKLEEVESQAIAYLIAFNLDEYQMHFSIGTEHPRVGWSTRVREADRDLSLDGPDGIKSIEPLTGTGLIPPHLAQSVAATFTAGFKRSHGGFKWGRLAKINHGSHYGFIEKGVVLSKLQPHLSTLIIYNDDNVQMKTWEEDDNNLLPFIKSARQNGVPIIEYDESNKVGVPGKYVSNWTLGNWSGSQDRAFRTLRAGVCLASNNNKKFLIYGYFSSVTPTAMARIFQAYQCNYAMHLDMNALEHTYLSIYSNDESGNLIPEQLIEGMKVLDQRFKGNVPRFIGYPDNRDFFYLTRGENH